MQLDKATLDGLYLFNQSPGHRIYTLVEFNHYYILPLLHGKVQLFYEQNKPVGLCTWCWFSEDEAEQFLSEALLPSEEHYSRPDDNAQYQLWGIEFIAPFGHARSVMRALDIKPDTHDVVDAPLPPVDFVGGKLAFDGASWGILDQQHYDDLAATRVRAKRDKLLVECDWVVIRAKELGQDVPREWFDYRSDLRNVPQQDGFPHDVVWPTHPAAATSQDEPAP